MKIYDQGGAEKDWTWLHATFGDGVRVDARPDPGQPGWEVTELRAKSGGACVLVVGAHGSPSGNPDVARWWDDPELAALPAELATWHPIGVSGTVNDNGDIGFGMGRGDCYRANIDWQPVSEVWVEGNSGRVHGLGWIVNTTYLHLDVRFDWTGGNEPPPFDPQPIIDQLDAILSHTQSIVEDAQHIVAEGNEVISHVNEARRLLA